MINFGELDLSDLKEIIEREEKEKEKEIFSNKN